MGVTIKLILKYISAPNKAKKNYWVGIYVVSCMKCQSQKTYNL